MRVTRLIARGLLCPLFTLTALVANAAMQVNVKYLSGLNNQCTVTPSNATLESGESQTFVITPNPGYRITGLFVDEEDVPVTRDGEKVTIGYASDMEVNLSPYIGYGVYTVTFDPCGGTISGASTMTVTNTADATWSGLLPTPTKIGCRFVGWYDGDTPVDSSTSRWLTENKMLVAKWEALKYRLSWTSSDGVLRVYCRTGGTGNYSQLSPSGTDIAFGTMYEWYAEPAYGYEVTPSQANPSSGTMGAHDAVLIPTATPRKFTITFDAQEGTVSETSREAVYGQKIGKLPTVSWSADYHRVFDGWSKNTYGSSRVDETEICEGDLTLYARWTDQPQGTIDVAAEPSDGGSVSGSGTFDVGQQITLNAEPREGYSFKQWHDGVTTSSRSVTVRSTQTVRYTATFTGNVYRVSFDVNREDASVDPTYMNVTYAAKYGELPTPICEGYRFLGWFTEPEDGSIIESTSYVKTTGVSGVIHLYAHWQKIPVFFVAFDGSGATDGLMATQKIVRGVSTALTSNVFTRVGYTYDGWTNATGSAYADGVSVYNLAAEDATVTLFAKWTPNKYHVLFDSNGQRGTMSPVSNRTYDVAFNLPENKFVNLTGEFLGWSTNKTATAAEWTDKASVKNLATDGTVTLYAVWHSLINELTEAAHCKNVVLTSAGQNLFTVYTNDTGYTSVKSGPKSTIDIGAPYNWGSWLMLTVGGRGTLTYHCKFTSADAAKKVLYYSDTSAQGTQLTWKPGDDGWMTVSETYTSDGDHTVKWASVNIDATQYLLIDRVVWMPEGDVVEPTEADAPTIGGFESTADGFSLSFTSDERFDYRVLSTTSLTPPIVWEPDAKMRLEGTGGTLTFQIPVGEGTDPARFFKVEVLPREAK